MRILEVVHGFPPVAQGGTELYAQAHASAMHRRHGDEVLVLTREDDRSRSEYAVRTEEREGIRVVWINNGFRSVRTFEETYANNRIDIAARRIVDEFGPDAAHIHHLTCLSTGIVRLLAERGVPTFMTLHDYWLMCHRGQLLDVRYRLCSGPPERGCADCLGPAGRAGAIAFRGAALTRAVEQHVSVAPGRFVRQLAERFATSRLAGCGDDAEAARRAAHMRAVSASITHFLAPSRYIRDRFVEFGVPASRIIVARIGIDHEPFVRPNGVVTHATESSAVQRPLRLGFFGTLMVSKAPHLLLEAARRLPAGSVSVDLFGDYSTYHGDDSYRRQLEPLLRDAHVRARGAIPHDRIPEALASIDIVVVPSIWPENCPLVIQEAFRARRPVVASNIGGIPELADHGRNSLLFGAGDVGDLTHMLARLIDDRDLLRTLRSGIDAVPSIEQDVALTRNLYENAAAARAVRLRENRLAAVVLNYRTPDETLLAVKSLRASNRRVDDIIVVDNDAAGDGGSSLADVRQPVTYVRTGTNLGFSGGINAGIREAIVRGAVRVLLVNSDVIVPPDAVGALEACLAEEPGAGIAGPIILARSEPDRIASFGMSYMPRTGRMRHRRNGESIGAAPLHSNTPVDAVSGCLMLIDKAVFDAVGLFDEDYFFSFEDLDFCLRARAAGFSTILAGGTAVYHEGGRSLGAYSPRRFYYAARNHLLLSTRAGPPAGRLMMLYRLCCVLALNLAHSVVSPGGSVFARVGAVARGVRDYGSGRFGSGL
jgi:GT2 family glycosyltransferase